MSNHNQPHETITENVQTVVDGERKVQPVLAFLCVYEISRHYGGAEEGGWWYDSYTFTGAAFPFQAMQEFEAQVLEGDDTSSGTDDHRQIWYDEDTKEYKAWVPVGLPIVTDEPTRVRLESARAHFIAMFGEPDSRYRFSVRPRGEDFAYIYELRPGERGEQPRPRYC